MQREDVIRSNYIFQRAIVIAVEGIHPKAVAGGFNWHEHVIACSDQR